MAQLDQAVREFLAENPDDIVTVVVDASFAHRIDPSELPTFEEAEEAGEVVSPPAGAIGRGDAFLLRIAEKTGATVLSNDSFQEFHGEHDWLFERGRLIGGKPVPGVGWIFTPRTPVRGPKSREAVKEAKRQRTSEDGTEGPSVSRPRSRGRKVEAAIATATHEVTAPAETARRRRRRAGEPPAEPINEPLAFITFIAAHPLGSEVEGAVDTFSSHGAFIDAGGARCYIPLSAMGDPPPRSAREMLVKGEARPFVVQALDPLRRGVELALPGYARVSGVPTEETVEAEIRPVPDDEDGVEVVAPRRRVRRVSTPAAGPAGTAPRRRSAAAGPEPAVAPPAKRAARTVKKAAVEPDPAAETAVAPRRRRPAVAAEPASVAVSPGDPGSEGATGSTDTSGSTDASGSTGVGAAPVKRVRAARKAAVREPAVADQSAAGGDQSGGADPSAGPQGAPSEGGAGSGSPGATEVPAPRRTRSRRPAPDQEVAVPEAPPVAKKATRARKAPAAPPQSLSPSAEGTAGPLESPAPRKASRARKVPAAAAPASIEAAQPPVAAEDVPPSKTTSKRTAASRRAAATLPEPAGAPAPPASAPLPAPATAAPASAAARKGRRSRQGGRSPESSCWRQGCWRAGGSRLQGCRGPGQWR